MDESTGNEKAASVGGIGVPARPSRAEREANYRFSYETVWPGGVKGATLVYSTWAEDVIEWPPAAPRSLPPEQSQMTMATFRCRELTATEAYISGLAPGFRPAPETLSPEDIRDLRTLLAGGGSPA